MFAWGKQPGALTLLGSPACGQTTNCMKVVAAGREVMLPLRPSCRRCSWRCGLLVTICTRETSCMHAARKKEGKSDSLPSCVMGPRCGLACCMKCMHKGWALYVEEESLPGFGKACLGLLLVSRWPYSWVGNGLHLRHKLGPNKS